MTKKRGNTKKSKRSAAVSFVYDVESADTEPSTDLDPLVGICQNTRRAKAKASKTASKVQCVAFRGPTQENLKRNPSCSSNINPPSKRHKSSNVGEDDGKSLSSSSETPPLVPGGKPLVPFCGSVLAPSPIPSPFSDQKIPIATYAQVEPILSRLSFYVWNKRYYLPRYCWEQEELGEAYFHTTEELRVSLRQNGVPKAAEQELPEEEYSVLEEWVRYAIVSPFLQEKDYVPRLDPMSGKEAIAKLQTFGAEVSKRNIWRLGEKVFNATSEFEDHLSRYGIEELPGLPTTEEEVDAAATQRKDAIRLALFLSENDRIGLWREKRYIETAAKRQLAESSRKKKDTSESYVPLAKIPTTPSADSGDGSVVATPPPDLGLQIGAQRHHPRTRRRRPAEGRHDTRKLKKKDPPEDVIFQKTDVARDDELSVAVLDLPSCDSSVGSHEPPTAQIDKVRRRMPPGRHRKERKSLESRSPEIQRDELALLDDVDYSGLPKHLFYWDTLGETRTRGVDFSWPTDVGSFLGYREKVGRVYYRSFTLRGHKYTVGDFVWKTESEERGVYRILSAFQATKSYMGYWSKKREHQKEELQKRGHVYLELAELSKSEEDGFDVHLLDRTCERRKSTAPAHTPLWLLGSSEEDRVFLEKIEVIVGCADEEEYYPSKEGSLVCRASRNRRNGRVSPLKDDEHEMLTCSPTRLLQAHTEIVWHAWHQSALVQMVHGKKEEAWENYGRKRCCGISSVPLQCTGDSSDNSDEFDRDSCSILCRPASYNNKASRKGTRRKVRNGEIKKLNGFDKTTWYPQDNPLPQLVIHQALNEEDNSDSEDENGIGRQTLLHELLGELYPTESATRRLKHMIRQVIQRNEDMSKHFNLMTNPVLPSGPPMEKLEKMLSDTLGCHSFRHPQGSVCLEAVTSSNDIFFVAPCGFGKSVCFIIPAVHMGGITLVVEPFKALIESQLQSLKEVKQVRVEKLLASDEGEKRAAERLVELTKLDWRDVSEPLILLATPELVMQPPSLAALRILSRQGNLKRIVVDEFDIIEDSREKYRNAYLDIFPKLRDMCLYQSRPIPIMCLTATISKQAILASRECSERDSIVPAKTFLLPRPLPDNHVYRVERKNGCIQVGKRIRRILSDHESQNNEKGKAVCFCLYPKLCERMAEYFRDKGISAEGLHSETNRAGLTKGIISRFKSGKTQIICATKALGRGFHDSDIRYIFHVYMPLSLKDYIQETGRGGRDSKKTHCIMFFSSFDRGMAENVVGLSGPMEKRLEDYERRKVEDDFKKVTAYAMSGDKCRYRMLAKAVALEEAVPIAQSCNKEAMCDNCCTQLLGNPSTISASKAILALASSKDGAPSSEFHLKKKEVSRILADSLSEVLELAKTQELMAEVEVEKCMKERVSVRYHEEDDEEQKRILATLIVAGGREPGTGADKSLLLEFLRNLRVENSKSLPYKDASASVPKGKKARTDWEKVKKLLSSIYSGHVKYFINNVRLPEARKRKPSKVMDVELGTAMPYLVVQNCFATEAFASYPRGVPDIWYRNDWICKLPFLVQFELCRLLENEGVRDMINKQEAQVCELVDKYAWDHSQRFELLQALEQFLKPKPSLQSYFAVLKKASVANLPVDERCSERAYGDGSALYFSARLDKDGGLALLPPERAIERRLFRKFGSHRFLHVNVKKDVPEEVTKHFFGSSKYLYGRQWSLFWCKMGKSPQTYIFFAEKGVGIKPEEEIKSADVWEWCIPKALNADITIGKFMKRLKLSFSKVTSAGILPEASVKLIPDFDGKGNVVEIDGNGLISREALNFVWREYCRNEKSKKSSTNQISSEEMPCPYTGFQGRLGGFRGQWILDEALGSGIRFHCRNSQYKYRLPQRCLKSELEEIDFDNYDSLYDTIEVNSWDTKPIPGSLNSRLIQLLEEAGVPAELFLKCADEATKWLSSLAEDPDLLVAHLKERQAASAERLTEETENNDTSFVFLMSLAKVNPSEPIFVERRDRLVRKAFKQMQSKAHYLLPSCGYVRIYGDHTLLLEEGEAYLALEDAANAKEIVAMRSPSYFAGDLRKLKLVDKFTLSTRAQNFQDPEGLPEALRRTPEQRFKFFENVRNALILCVKGRSEADKMSGGDYDGDKAWTCWNPHLVDHVQAFEAHDTSNFEVKKGHSEQKIFWETTIEDRLSYFSHFRGHQAHLGYLAELLDKSIDCFGFDHEFTQDLGRASFLQVDEPYTKVKLRGDIDENMLEQKKWPHWKGRERMSQEYHSKKVLGKIWDFLEAKFKEAIGGVEQEVKADDRILKFVTKCLEEKWVDETTVVAMRKKYKKTIQRYLMERELHAGQYNEGYFKWHDQICKSERSALLLSEKGQDRKLLVAAILYEQAADLILETSARDHKKAMGFAWCVASDYLCRITSDLASEDMGSGKLPFPLVQDMTSVLLGRDKRS